MNHRNNNRERILAVERILTNKPQTVLEIIRRLELEYGIECERRAVYKDIAVLSLYIPIVYRKGYFVQRH